MQQDPGSLGRDGIDLPPPPARSVRRPRRLLALVVPALLVVVGGAAAAAFVLMRGAGEELLQLVPASSEVVVTASKDDAAAETALERALGRSLGTEGVREYRGVSMHVFGTGSSLTTYAIVQHVVVLSNHAIGLTRVIDVSMGTTAAIADDPK